MAAGGFKTFTTGEVLTSADTNNFLMQGVLVFNDATARDAAITAPVEGQVVYLKDTNQVLSYDGSTYAAVGGGSPLTTKGDLYTFSTVDARLPVGANGTILVADSSTATGLAFAAPAGGGKVLQVVQGSTTTTASNSTATYADSGLTATITPSAATSKILVLFHQNGTFKSLTGNSMKIRAMRSATAISEQTAGDSTGAIVQASMSNSILDAPNTTSAVTYKTQFANTDNTTLVQVQATSASVTSRSAIILMEIGA